MNFGNRHIKIHVYVDDHPPPHCHVLRSGVETRVAIPSMLVLSGPKLDRQEVTMVMNVLDELCDEFDRLNPPQHINNDDDEKMG